MNYQDILDFWFAAENQKNWFNQSDAFDQSIEMQFKTALLSASKAELWHWRTTPEGRLAEIIVLDQFSRNLYRDSPLAFAQDAQAVVLPKKPSAWG